MVVVAGGGPVGLFAAALLDAAGVDVAVFERDSGPSEHSKGMTVHPRTLEVLDALDLSEELVAHGERVPHAHFAVLPDMLDYSHLPTAYPFTLMIPQARTEQRLVEHLRSRDVPVHYDCPVTGFEQRDGAVLVHTADSSHEAEFLVGADGARSVVRAQAGIDFLGNPPTSVGFVGDLELTDPPEQALHLWSLDGQISVVPMPNGAHRVFGTVPEDTGISPETVRERQSTTLEFPELRGKLRKIAGTDFGATDARTLARIGDTTRYAARYRSGRVLLAGDAAHVHFPAGGQGLNVGLQDAANLCWKLAAEIHGWAPPRVVHGDHSYERERRPVAAALAKNTLAQGALMKTFTPEVEALRGVMSDLIARGGDTADELAGWLSGIDLSYPRPEGTDPLVGTRAPDLALPGANLHRALRPDRFLLADFTGGFADLDVPHVEVRTAEPGSGRWSDLAAALIRPDGYVADVAAPGGEHEFTRAVAEWTTPVS